LDIEARDKLIELDEKRRCAGRNSIAYVDIPDSGYNSKEIDTPLSNPHLVTILDFPTLPSPDSTGLRKPLYANVAT